MITVLPYGVEPLAATSTPDKIQAFERVPNFSNLAGKTFDIAGGNIPQRTLQKHEQKGINTDPLKKLEWYYEAQIRNLILGVLQKSYPNGLSTLSNAELDTLAANIASNTHEYIVTDYEPDDHVSNGWIWESYNQGGRISYLSQKVKELSLSGAYYKKYLDWFAPKGFTYGGKQLGLLTNNGVFEFGGASVNDYIACHADPSGASNFDDNSSVLRIGWGYTAITPGKIDNAGGSPYPAKTFFGPIPSYLKSLDALALCTALRPNTDILYILWAREDQERLNYPIRHRLGGNTQGFVRMNDNRLSYPFHLVEGNTFIANSFKRVKKIHAWIMPNSENPYDILRYAKRNGQVFCLDVGFDLANYTGPDQYSLQCPTTSIDFMNPSEAKGFNAHVSGIHRSSLAADVLDGTQTASFPAFRWKYGTGSWNNVAALSDLSGFARAWKNKTPFCLKQTNSGAKNLLIFQQPFAMAFEPVRFECSSLGVDEWVEGNNVFGVKIT